MERDQLADANYPKPKPEKRHSLKYLLASLAEQEEREARMIEAKRKELLQEYSARDTDSPA